MTIPALPSDEIMLAARAAQIFVRSHRLAYAEIAPDLTIVKTSPNFWALGRSSTTSQHKPRRGRVKLSHVLDEFVGADAALKAILFGESPEYILEFVNRNQPDGSIAYLTFRVTPLDERFPQRGLLLIVEDVTEVGQLAQGLAQERNTLRLAQAELQRVNAELERLSFTDPLTGLGNRRRFDSELTRELNRAARLSHPLALLMVDLDNLKVLNDTYGHRAGDSALRRLAAWLQVNVRNMDLVARWGGDEFAILLPETGVERACQVAKRLLTVPKLAALSTEDEPWDEEDAVFRMLTISIGGAVAPGGVFTEPTMLIHAADTALYQAKRAGKNQFVIYSDE